LILTEIQVANIKENEDPIITEIEGPKRNKRNRPFNVEVGMFYDIRKLWYYSPSF